MSTFRYDTTVQLVKAKGPDGKDKMLMKGIASNSSKDTDGHNLDPSGFDVSYFLDKGFINWNHEWKKSPTSIIGRPNKAFINKANELEIEYSLFKGHKTAEEVYELAGILENNGIYLGLSIEGEVVETDPNDKNKITKARITDCAVTPHPKNSGTVTSIIKGNHFEELVDFEKMPEFEVSPDGRLLIKGTTTETAEDLMPESLEGGPKQKKKEKKEMENEKKKISKSQVFDHLQKLKPSITLQQAEAVYDYTYKFQKSLEMSEVQNAVPTEVTEEAFQGALQKLGLSKGTETAEVTGAPAGPAGEKPAQSASAPAAGDNIEKSQKSYSDMTEEERVEYKANLQKAQQEIEVFEKGQSGAPVETAATVEEKKPAVSEGDSELVKAVRQAIIEGNKQAEATFNEKFQALGTLEKGNRELIKGLESKIQELQGQPIPTRATTTQSYVAKPGEELQKGGNGQPLGDQDEVYSFSQQKNALCTRLTDAAIEKAQGVENINPRLKADLIAMEGMDYISPTVVEFAKSLNIQIIQ